jgi:hypothetical protein
VVRPQAREADHGGEHCRRPYEHVQVPSLSFNLVEEAATEMRERDTYGWIKGRQGSRKPMPMFLYVISEVGAGKPCKIGYAANPEKRRFTLSCGNPRALVLASQYEVSWPADEKWLDYVGRVQDLEKRLHSLFEPLWVRGEWFDVHATDVQEAIEALL